MCFGTSWKTQFCVIFPLTLLKYFGMCWSIIFFNSFNQKQFNLRNVILRGTFKDCCTALSKGNSFKHQNNMRGAHHWGLGRSVLLYSRDALRFGDRLALQDIGLDHFEVPALRGHVAVSEWDQDGASVLAGEPLVRLQRRIGAGGVRIQVVLEQIRLRGEGRREVVTTGRKWERKALMVSRLSDERSYLPWNCHDDGFTLSLM